MNISEIDMKMLSTAARYRVDPEFRESFLNHMRKRYKKVSVNCKVCNKRRQSRNVSSTPDVCLKCERGYKMGLESNSHQTKVTLETLQVDH